MTTDPVPLDSDPLTARFHRSTREAFADERGQWLEHYNRRTMRAPLLLLALAACVAALLLVLTFAVLAPP